MIAKASRRRALTGGASFAVLSLCLAVPAPAPAADAAGRFAVDGPGAASCADFLRARDAGGAALAGFAGWAAGFISAVNVFTPDTYDVTPWQTVELVTAMLAAHCARATDQPFVEATGALVGALTADRLTTLSPIVQARKGGTSVVLYAAILDDVRARLNRAGHDPGSGSGFDAAFAGALSDWQKANGVPVTGLPDQPTLNDLMR